MASLAHIAVGLAAARHYADPWGQRATHSLAFVAVGLGVALIAVGFAPLFGCALWPRSGRR